MYIRIAEKNRDEIEALLQAANGRAWLHVWSSYDEIVSASSVLERILDDSGLPKTHRPGALAAMYSCNPKAFANVYRNDVVISEACLERKSQGWFLKHLERTPIRVARGARHQIYRFQISPEQAERCDAAWRKRFRISVYEMA